MKCTCKIIKYYLHGHHEQIKQCPLCAAAPELLEACKVSEITLRDIATRHTSHSFHNNRVHSDSYDAIDILKAAIKAANLPDKPAGSPPNGQTGD